MAILADHFIANLNKRPIFDPKSVLCGGYNLFVPFQLPSQPIQMGSSKVASTLTLIEELKEIAPRLGIKFEEDGSLSDREVWRIRLRLDVDVSYRKYEVQSLDYQGARHRCKVEGLNTRGKEDKLKERLYAHLGLDDSRRGDVDKGGQEEKKEDGPELEEVQQSEAQTASNEKRKRDTASTATEGGKEEVGANDGEPLKKVKGINDGVGDDGKDRKGAEEEGDCREEEEVQNDDTPPDFQLETENSSELNAWLVIYESARESVERGHYLLVEE